MAGKKENPAKIYLMEIEKLDIKINQKCKLIDELRTRRFNVQAVNFSNERVKSSTKNNVNNLSDKILDIENEINKDIDRFYDMKNKMINQIQQLEKKEYVEILHKKYIEYNIYPTLEHIAVSLGENGRSWRHTARLHGEALESFRKKFL